MNVNLLKISDEIKESHNLAWRNILAAEISSFKHHILLNLSTLW